MSRVLYTLSLFALPIVVAAYGFHVAIAVLLVLGLLLWRQALVLGPLMKRPAGPALELETILPSHFAEKGRWCLDRLGVDYAERRRVGVIGVFFLGRTVPMLTIQTGRTRSSLCESSDILRYLYGRYAGDPAVETDWLEPTEERLAWEQRIDRYGIDQQVWVYHFLLKDPALCKLAWGAENPNLPQWERWTVKLFYPVLEIFMRRAFDPNTANYRAAVERTEALLADTEALLADGRRSLLGGVSSDYVDLTLASLSALWLRPAEFAAGDFAPVAPPEERLPPGWIADRDRWRERFPATTAHLERLFREERLVSA